MRAVLAVPATFLVILAAACSAGGPESAASGAQSVGDGEIYDFGTLAHPGSCMDARAAGTGDGTQIQEWDCNGTGAQSYEVVAAGGGAFNIVSTHANKCVDVAGAGTADGTQVRLWDCNGTGAQAFVFEGQANGFVTIVNTNSSKCLDVQGDNPADGTVVQLFQCNGTDAQLWNPAVIGAASTGGGSTGSTGLATCSGSELSACNCPGTFSCCPIDGSCFQSIDQLVFTKCKGDPASACSMSGAGGGDSPPSGGTGGGSPGGGASGGGSSGGGSSGGGSSGGGTVNTCGASVPPGARVITVTNECPGQTLSVGVNGGFVQNCDNGACPAGSTCNTQRNPPGCFWDFPSPACGSSVLPSGASATYVLPPPAAGSSFTWSGNVYAATRCAVDGTGCRTAQCVQSVNGQTVIGACPDGIGPQGPTTLAEFTLGATGADFYDVSSINGVNVPVSMGPVGGALDPSNPYTCATAGAVSPTSGLVGCSWSFDPTISGNDESAVLRAVAPGGAGCSSDSQCPSGQVCGTPLVFGGAGSAQSCGEQVAWWTADELCAYTGNAAGGALACNAGVPGQGTQSNLYACNGANSTSAYNAAQASPTSCGCPDWVVDGQSLALAPGFACHANNQAWQSIAEPWAAFLKNACPTAYSFPFDDATSTFTCSTPDASASNLNSMDYAITFCPGGAAGF